MAEDVVEGFHLASFLFQAVVEGSARFRSKGRLPVLTYLHRNGAAIVRCAQPLVGIGGVRSSYDEKYVECLRLATPGAATIHVVDTRPPINALANRAGGKGYESDRYYENIQVRRRWNVWDIRFSTTY